MKILPAIGLRKLFAIVTVFLALISIISSILLIVSTTRLHKNTVRIGEAAESIHIAGQLQINLLTLNREHFLWQISGKQEHYNNSEIKGRELYRLLEKSTQFIGTPLEEAIIQRLERAINNYFIHRDQLETERLFPLEVYTRITPTLNKAFQLTEELIKLNQLQSESLQEETYEQDKLANITGVFIGILVFVLVFALLVFIKQFIYNPIIGLCETINEFTPSNLEIKAPEKGPKEIREIAKTFNNMADRLVKQRESQYRFLAAIAHDLKNPINAIVLSSQLLEELEVKAETKTMVGVVQRQAKQLNRMVGDLLDTARIEAGKLELQKRSEDITDIVRNAIDLYKSTSSIHKINLIAPDYPIYCTVDSVRISQVMNNLLSNAIKYSPHGGIIHIEIVQREDEIIISVADEGIGISEEEKVQIFEPFRRTAKTRETISGVGLGLSVTKRILEAHGGRIIVKSQLNAGSTFFIYLPINNLFVINKKSPDPKGSR